MQLVGTTILAASMRLLGQQFQGNRMPSRDSCCAKSMAACCDGNDALCLLHFAGWLLLTWGCCNCEAIDLIKHQQMQHVQEQESFITTCLYFANHNTTGLTPTASSITTTKLHTPVEHALRASTSCHARTTPCAATPLGTANTTSSSCTPSRVAHRRHSVDDCADNARAAAAALDAVTQYTTCCRWSVDQAGLVDPTRTAYSSSHPFHVGRHGRLGMDAMSTTPACVDDDASSAPLQRSTSSAMQRVACACSACGLRIEAQCLWFAWWIAGILPGVAHRLPPPRSTRHPHPQTSHKTAATCRCCPTRAH